MPVAMDWSSKRSRKQCNEHQYDDCDFSHHLLVELDRDKPRQACVVPKTEDLQRNGVVDFMILVRPRLVHFADNDRK